MENKTLYGRWMMIVSSDTYTVPTGYIAEISENRISGYSFDKKLWEQPLVIDTKNQQFLLGNNDAIRYEMTENGTLKKFYTNQENEISEVNYVKLEPTTIKYSIPEVLKNQYKLLPKEKSGPSRDQIFDFTNSNAHIIMDITIEKLHGVFFIVGYQQKKRIWGFPIKEIHEDYLLIYGFSMDSFISKLLKYTPKKTVQPEGKIDVFLEPKLNLLIEELKDRKEKLQNELDEATEFKDYLTAHHLMTSYHSVNRRFNTLSSIKNKNHNSITGYEFMLENFESRLQKETDQFRLDHLKTTIKEYKERITRLKADEQELRPQTTVLSDALLQLCDRKINKIQLQLNEKHQANLDIRLEDDKLVIIMDSNGKEGYLDCDFKVLQSLNFGQEGNHFVYFLDNFNENHIDSLMTLLSRLTFEAFHHNSLDNPMELILS